MHFFTKSRGDRKMYLSRAGGPGLGNPTYIKMLCLEPAHSNSLLAGFICKRGLRLDRIIHVFISRPY